MFRQKRKPNPTEREREKEGGRGMKGKRENRCSVMDDTNYFCFYHY